MPYGMGPWGWLITPYQYWGWGRCRWSPWLPRWWWTGIYGSITPYSYGYPYLPISKEDEIKLLEDMTKFLEEQLNEIRRRLDELKK